MAFEKLHIVTKKNLGGVTLDAVLLESHDNRVRLTRNPVELGVDITDHAVIEPKRLTLIAQVSDSPLGIESIGVIVDTVTGFFGSATSDRTTRSISAYNALIALMDVREPIQVLTKLRLYSNMVIVGINVNQDRHTSNVARLFIDLEEVIITESETVDITEEHLQDGKITEQATPPKDSGRKEAVTPNEATQKSVIKSISDWIRG